MAPLAPRGGPMKRRSKVSGNPAKGRRPKASKPKRSVQTSQATRSTSPSPGGAEMREAIGALTETWRRWGHEIGFGIGIAHGFATLGTIGFEGRFDYAAIGTVSNVASLLSDEAKPGQIPSAREC
jgi:class 3 adenylate cyclase